MEAGDEPARVLANFFLKSETFRRAYARFRKLFLKPIGWLYVRDEPDRRRKLTLIDRRTGGESFGMAAPDNAHRSEALLKSFDTASHEPMENFPRLMESPVAHPCACFVLAYENRIRGFLALDALKPEAVSAFASLGEVFQDFLASEVTLAYRNYEIKTFYETVHPRALALSTLHSVHRVISASLRLKDLLPRIARLSAQVLRAHYAGIYLLDESREYLVAHFILGEEQRGHKRHRVGRGLEGRVAQSGDAVLQKRLMCVPLIGDEVLGVLTLRRSAVEVPFRRIELEILRTIAEQAVIAIRNSKLYEEGEAITLGSIKTINDILELGYKGDTAHLPLFAELVQAIGEETRLSEDQLEHLNRAVFLLDTGHVGVSREILEKKTPLTKRELQRIKQHPIKGATLLGSIQSLRPVIPIILHHHERYDGKGYPQGLSGHAIPLGARIVSVVDAFTAMMSDRPYRKRKGVAEALEEIKAQSGKQFDPEVVKCFLKVLAKKDLSSYDRGDESGPEALRKGA